MNGTSRYLIEHLELNGASGCTVDHLETEWSIWSSDEASDRRLKIGESEESSCTWCATKWQSAPLMAQGASLLVEVCHLVAMLRHLGDPDELITSIWCAAVLLEDDAPLSGLMLHHGTWCTIGDVWSVIICMGGIYKMSLVVESSRSSCMSKCDPLTTFMGL